MFRGSMWECFSPHFVGTSKTTICIPSITIMLETSNNGFYLLFLFIVRYGIPGKYKLLFDNIIKSFYNEKFNMEPDIIQNLTLQISISLLLKNNIPIYSVKQDENSFVITFPKSYHCGLFIILFKIFLFV